MFSTLYYNHIYYPSWGAITINKALVRDVAYPKEMEFFYLFDEVKKSKFQLGRRNVYQLNKKVQDYVLSSFGNYSAVDITAEHFRKIEQEQFLFSFHNYIIEQFQNSELPKNQQDDFKESVLPSLEFAIKGASSFFQFTPDNTIQTIIPDTARPFSHFTAYLIIGNEVVEGTSYPVITCIKMFDD